MANIRRIESNAWITMRWVETAEQGYFIDDKYKEGILKAFEIHENTSPEFHWERNYMSDLLTAIEYNYPIPPVCTTTTIEDKIMFIRNSRIVHSLYYLFSDKIDRTNFINNIYFDISRETFSWHTKFSFPSNENVDIHHNNLIPSYILIDTFKMFNWYQTLKKEKSDEEITVIRDKVGKIVTRICDLKIINENVIIKDRKIESVNWNKAWMIYNKLNINN